MAAIEPEWTLGDRLRKAREVAGLSREEMADQLGVNKANVWNWENDVSRPRDVLDVTYEWAHITGVHVEWLRSGHARRRRPKAAGEPEVTDNNGFTEIDPESNSYQELPFSPVWGESLISAIAS